MYHNERDEHGSWRNPPATREAIEAERARPWTAEETKVFAGRVDELAGQMGSQWGPELGDIVARGRRLADPQVALSELSAAAETSHSREQPIEAEVDPPEPTRDLDLGDDLEL